MNFHSLRIRWPTVGLFWASTLLLAGAWVAYVRWHGVPAAMALWVPGIAQWAVLVAAALAIGITARDAWRRVGWARGPLRAYVAVGVAVPATVAAIHGLGMLVGAVQLAREGASAGPPMAVYIPFVLLVSFITSFGEEFGWRGLLLPELLPLGRVQALVVSGLAWATFEVLLVYGGVLSTELGSTHMPMALLSSVVGTVATAVIFGELRLRYDSVFVPTFAHACLNTSAGVASLYFVVVDPTIGGLEGAVGLLASIGVAVLMLRMSKKK